MLLGIEFLPILFVIVYVGAIAILFLFVVMLLNIKLVEITENASRYAPIGIIVGFIFLYQIFNSFGAFDTYCTLSEYETTLFSQFFNQSNVELVAEILYTEYALYFLLSSLVLLVSMIGAIVLCLFHETSIKRQDLFAQVSSDYERNIR
jgi:NADH-quinone oxidoreductase subunit J